MTAAHAAVAHVRAVASAAAHPPVDPGLLAAVRAHARVDVHFHRDRLLADHRTVGEHLLTDGRHRSQYETRISNGGLTARPVVTDPESWADRGTPADVQQHHKHLGHHPA